MNLINIYKNNETMKLLYITSCLYSTISIHAYYVKHTYYHHLFLLVSIFSILFHTTNNKYIAIIDKLIAHIAFIYVIIFDTYIIYKKSYIWLLLYPIITFNLWYLQKYLTTLELKNTFHLFLHIISIIGVHNYIYLLHY